MKTLQPDQPIDVTRRGVTETSLFEGDRITVSISHEIKVGGETTWIKYEASSTVRPHEHPAVANERIVDHVNDSAMDTVYKTVTKIRGA